MTETCAACKKEILSRARTCPHCSQKIFRGYQWRSEAEIFGWPLIHIAAGRDKNTGKILVAKGIIAIGQFAIGLISIGQIGIGICFGLGQIMTGYIAIGQIAIGIYFGMGQVATGWIAVGQVALGFYALCQIGMAKYLLSTQGKDPVAVEYFTNIWNTVKSFWK